MFFRNFSPEPDAQLAHIWDWEDYVSSLYVCITSQTQQSGPNIQIWFFFQEKNGKVSDFSKIN